MRLPNAYPDELIGSIFIRGSVHTGLPPKRLLIRVLGRERSHQSMFLPTGLTMLAEATQKTPSQLLWGHTAFPFAVAFMSPQQVAALEAKALAASGSGQVSLGSLARSATQGVARLRFCPECAMRDLAAFGESYWHRSHCLPAVHVCLTHKAELYICERQPLTLSQHLLLPLPHQLSTQGRTRRRSLAGINTRDPALSLFGLLEPTSCPPALKEVLAEAAAELLSDGWRPRFDWHREYRDAAQRRYSMSSRLIAGARLAYELKALFSSEYLEELKCDFEGWLQRWPGAMVRNVSSASFSPVKHLLFRTFLKSAPEVAEAARLEYRQPGKRPRDYGALDAHLAAMVHQETKRLLSLQQVTTAQSLLRALGHWETFRHVRIKLPLTDAAIQLFLGTDASARKTGGRAAHANRLKAIAEGRQKPPKAWQRRASQR